MRASVFFAQGSADPDIKLECPLRPEGDAQEIGRRRKTMASPESLGECLVLILQEARREFGAAEDL